MALAQQNVHSQTSGLTQTHIKGPSDDGLDSNLDDGLDGSLGDGLDNGLDGSLDDGLSDLVRRHTARKPDEKREVVVGESTTLQTVLKKFQEILNLDKSYSFDKLLKPVDETLTEVLTPEDIGKVFQVILYETEDEPIDQWNSDRIAQRIGIFVSKLVQLSYDAGHNDFLLVTQNSKRIISYIGYNLKGTRERLLRLNIQGNTVDSLLLSGVYCEVDVTGSIYHDLGRYDSMGSYSIYCVFMLRSKICEGESGNVNNIFKTSTEDTLKKLIFGVSRRDGNQIVFIKPDGEEVCVLKYYQPPYLHKEHFVVDINQNYYDIVKPIFERRDDIYKATNYKVRIVKGLKVTSITQLEDYDAYWRESMIKN